MGFLSSSKVQECSASDLVGQYVGQTGPKTKKLFEKALGQVLFIDEAYRLSEGRFAQEAIDELVGLLTQERFKSKIVVVLAGYEQDINKLLNVNSGLSSRFPVTIPFKNFPPKSCLEILDKALSRQKINLAVLHNPSSKGYLAMESVVEDLSAMPSWANARDMETVAKQMGNLVLKRLPDSGQAGQLSLSVKDAVDVMLDMLDEQRSRSNMSQKPRSRNEDMQEDASSSPPPPNPPPSAAMQHSSPPPPPPPQQQQWRQKNRKHPSASQNHNWRASRPPSPVLPPPVQSSSQTPPRPYSSISASTSKLQSPLKPSSWRSQRPRKISQSQPRQLPDPRDDSVSDATWQKLLEDEQAAERAAKTLEDETRQAQRKMQQAIQDEDGKRAAVKAARQAEEKAKDEAARQEAKRQREEHECKERAAAAARQRLAAAFQAKRMAEENKKREEAKVQNALRTMGVCVQGYQWVKQLNGYRCRGGAHFIPHSQLRV